MQPPEGYSDDDIEQHAIEASSRLTETDARNPFQHDVDRILYSEEFRALAGKTQVIASDQLGGYHNRLTHSLKVAQMAKRMAVLLTQRANEEHSESFVGPDPDLMEAAGLLHDIGHPPFGHVGEQAMRKALSTNGRADGFQANAQNLRIATYLAVRRERTSRGLNLTRATLDSSTKYPWLPGCGYSDSHWGCFADEASRATLRWVLNDEEAPYTPPQEKPDGSTGTRGLRRPVEEQIMDWADEVTYACHDVEDFYRAGILPLGEIIHGVPREDVRAGEPNEMGYETGRFVKYILESASKKRPDLDQERVIKVLQNVRNKVGTLYPFVQTWDGRGRSTSATSGLIVYFMGGRPSRPADNEPDTYRLSIEPLNGSQTLTRYGACLRIDPDLADAAFMLNKLIWFYVIDRPSLASQQTGQRRILEDLLDWFSNDPGKALPDDRKEEWNEHGDARRAAADAVASLTETEAFRLHGRMTGRDWGQITDIT